MKIKRLSTKALPRHLENSVLFITSFHKAFFRSSFKISCVKDPIEMLKLILKLPIFLHKYFPRTIFHLKLFLSSSAFFFIFPRLFSSLIATDLFRKESLYVVINWKGNVVMTSSKNTLIYFARKIIARMFNLPYDNNLMCETLWIRENKAFLS